MPETTEVTGGPWTSHGHAIPGVTVHGHGRPPIARCGGPALCAKCSIEAQAVTASQPLPLAELSPAEQAEIERFGIYEAEEKVEKVARALWEADNCLNPDADRGFLWALTDNHGLANRYRRLAAAAIAEMPVSPAEKALRRATTVDRLSRHDFGLWVETATGHDGYLYAVHDDFHDGYPGRTIVLVDAEGGAIEVEFTDSDPAGYPKTMGTPCVVGVEPAAIAAPQTGEHGQ